MKWIYTNDSENVTLALDSIASEFSIPYNGENFINPKINLETLQIYEGATIEEIEEEKQKIKLKTLNDFLINKKKDGEIYYNEIELSLTILLPGLPINDLIVVNNEIELKIKPILNEIKMGDWFNAYMKLWINNNIERPESNILKQTYDNVKVRVKQYFENNYPR